MSKRQILMLLGLWSGVLLFLGFPDSWDKLIMVATAIIMVGIAYSIKGTAPMSDKEVPFVENKRDVRNYVDSMSADVQNPMKFTGDNNEQV